MQCIIVSPKRENNTPVLLQLQCNHLKKAPHAFKVTPFPCILPFLIIITVRCNNSVYTKHCLVKTHAACISLSVRGRAKCQHTLYVTLIADCKLRMSPVSFGVKTSFNNNFHSPQFTFSTYFRE